MPTAENPLFWESLFFSSANVALVVLTVWWLSWSPIRNEVTHAAPPSPRLAGWLAALLGLASLQLVAGAFWDASMHVQTGEIPAGADFLWPPHIMIYSAFLISLIVTLIALSMIAIPAWRAGERDPRRWVRLNPYLGAVAVASMYSLLSIPGDALWHALYGIDLTAWSPPHLMLGIMTCVVVVCALGLLLQARPRMSRPDNVGWASIGLLGLMLNFAYILAALEWEMPGNRSPLVEARPIWIYPLVGGGAAFFTLALAKRVTRLRWAATLTAAVFYLVRLGITWGLGLTGNIQPYFPLWFILGAVLMDLAPQPSALAPHWQALAVSGLFTLGYAALAFPALTTRLDLRAFTTLDAAVAIGAIWIATAVLWPLAQWTGRALEGESAPA